MVVCDLIRDQRESDEFVGDYLFGKSSSKHGHSISLRKQMSNGAEKDRDERMP